MEKKKNVHKKEKKEYDVMELVAFRRELKKCVIPFEEFFKPRKKKIKKEEFC